MTLFRTCPDCGGLLEPVRPEWMDTIDLASDRPSAPPPSGAWQCLICGYEDASPEPDGLPEIGHAT